MSPHKSLYCLLLAWMLPFACWAAEPRGRERIRLDAGWKFHLGAVAGSDIYTGVKIPSWRYKPAGKAKPTDEKPASLGVSTGGADWQDAQNGQDLFNHQPGFAWVKAPLPDAPGPHRVLHFAGVDDNATVWVNGTKMTYHEGWNDPFDINLDAVWKEGGPNEVTVLVENTYGEGNIKEAGLMSLGPEEPVPPAALEAFDDQDWKEVHLPHDFVVEGPFSPSADGNHGFLPKDPGWYRKSFKVPLSDKGRSLWIDFDGVYRDSRVWLNGKLLGKHPSGYTSFRYDITGAIKYGGVNTLAVYVDARDTEGWWYEGGGIYRHIWLNKADPLHVEPWGVYVVSNPDQEVDPNQASLEIQTSVDNRSKSLKSCQVVSEVLDKDGKTVLSLTEGVTVPPGETGAVTQKGEIPHPALWSPDSPSLYTLVTSLEKDGKVVDQATTRFGVRTARFDKDLGFFLNGKPLKLKGTCNHQDFAGIGIAIPDRVFTYRIQRLKDMGSNAYRCSHNPPASELLDECDRQGMLVMDENRRLGDDPEILSQLESMVLRDRNHPSVILWSLCNEESLQGTETGKHRGEAMKKDILRLDKTRLITCAMNYGWGSGLSDVVDLQGFNYHPSEYGSYHKSHPGIPLFGSETASTVSDRGIYQNNKDQGYVSAYDENFPDWAQTAEDAWTPLAKNPFMAGGFVWTGFDYRGEPTPYWWPCVNSHFGVMDMCGFPKDNFFYYQAWWGGNPLVHLLPHWNWPDKEGEPVDVWCYGNCEKVELFLNGKSLGEKDMPQWGHLEWKVPYHAGVLSAVGSNAGKKAAEDRVETTDAPASVKLEPFGTEMLSDGEDEIPVKVSILDVKGRVVPTADNEVVFHVTGPGSIAGVANGDPSSHEPDKADQRRAFNGLCMAIVKAGDEPGDVVLTAESKDLKGAAVTLHSSTAASR